MSTGRNVKPKDALQTLDELNGGPVTTGQWLAAIRIGDEISQADFARTLGISRAQLCDIEKGRKLVSAARAYRWGEQLGYGGKQFMRSALEDLVRRETQTVSDVVRVSITVD